AQFVLDTPLHGVMTSGMASNDRSHISCGQALLYACLAMLFAVVLGAKVLPDVLAGGLTNPDSYMRLVRLEDALRRQDISFVVARDGSGSGTLLHWSHLIDMLLCIIAAPLRIAMSTHDALHAAAAVFGPLCMGGLGVALAWAIAPVVDRRWLWLTPA